MSVDSHTEAMTPALVRAARAILNWSANDLATRSGVSRSTVQAYETGISAKRSRGMNNASKAALARTIYEAGVEFVGGDAPGVIVRRPELLE